jgi:hypothetical protein
VVILKEFKLFGINTFKSVDSRGFRLPKNGAIFVAGECGHAEALDGATASTERLVECSVDGCIGDWLWKSLTPEGVSYSYFA